MSREIKFRAKGQVYPKWFYGYYLKNKEGDSFIRSTENFETYWILEETLGEFTGLYAKGIEIYEGDICKIKFNIDDVSDYVYILLNEEESKKSERIFLVGSPLFNNQYEFMCEDIEIIGNIHDNPELLEKNND